MSSGAWGWHFAERKAREARLRYEEAAAAAAAAAEREAWAVEAFFRKRMTALLGAVARLRRYQVRTFGHAA